MISKLTKIIIYVPARLGQVERESLVRRSAQARLGQIETCSHPE